MQRLTHDAIAAFAQANPTALILFGAPMGEATMNQALDFAEAWAAHRQAAGFAYVDAFAEIAAARAYKVRVLPTILALRHGEVVERLEGGTSAPRLAAALANAAAPARAA